MEAGLTGLFPLSTFIPEGSSEEAIGGRLTHSGSLSDLSHKSLFNSHTMALTEALHCGISTSQEYKIK